MGMLDTAKMIRKAQKAKSQMSKVQVVGVSKSGNTAVMLNGLSEVVEIEFDDGIFDLIEFTDLYDFNDEDELEDSSVSNRSNIKTTLAEEVKEAYKDAKKKLEKELASNFDINSLSDMFN